MPTVRRGQLVSSMGLLGLFCPTRLSRLIGLLLLTAAILKFTAGGAQPVRSSGFLSSAPAQMALIVLEITLGAWLLSGRRPMGSWFISLIVFSVFAVVTFRQGWIGQASCGCLGKVVVNPWYTFALDLGVLGLLLVGRPNLRTLREYKRADLRPILGTTAVGIAGVGLFLAMLVGVAHWQFGSVEAALASVRGERVSIRPTVVDLGKVASGEAREVEIEVANWTDHEIRVIGGTKD